MTPLVIEADVRRIWCALRFVDAATQRLVDGPLELRSPGVRWQRNASGLFVAMQIDAPPERRAEFAAYEAAFHPLPAVAPLALAGTVADPLQRFLPRRFALALPRSPEPAGRDAPRFTPIDIVLDPSPAAKLQPTWAVLRVSLRRAGRPAASAALRLRRAADGAPLGRGLSDARGEALVVAAGLPLLNVGAGVVVVQREIAAELVVSFDAAAPAGQPVDPDALAQAAGVVRVTVARNVSSGRTESLAFDLP